MFAHIADPVVMDINVIDRPGYVAGVVKLDSAATRDVFNKVVCEFPLRPGVNVNAVVEQGFAAASHTSNVVDAIA